MAKSPLPLIALGAAALFLLKKKDEPKPTNGQAKGNGINTDKPKDEPADKPADEPKDEPKDVPEAEPNAEPIPEPEPLEPGELPPNLNLEPIGDFQWGARIRLGDDVTDAQTTQAIDIAAKHAAEHSALPFVVTLFPGAQGIQVHIMADGQPYAEWAENVTYLDATLADMLSEHIPTP